MNPRHTLELLAPAKNADIGIEAVTHGADAVYIGGPSFGARSAAENTVADIARLTAHAHRFHARVFVALNTILRDDELEPARQLIWQLYEAGADALIVQDMGLLQLDLPPIQLHASTQTDIRDAAKARFLQDVGFSQIVLARELTLDEVKKVAAATTCQLEYFVHGALCVAFSGQCYISHAHTGRSANRGECSQACRLPYDLADQNGNVIARDQHMLSMKDNNQSANLRVLAAAGVSSFKIEGRYKDLSYVKNITAHYRQLLDEVIEHPDADGPDYRRASSGRSTFLFTPQAEKTFNRGYTDYFTNKRQHGIEAFESPKFVGEAIGRVTRIDTKGHKFFELERVAPIHNGDGLTWYDAKGDLTGLRVNRAEQDAAGAGVDRLFPADSLP
ncbi:MAG: collagenase-like protease, partial [Betaproteobacteria bacterium HGW-Betaproteobacteria-21]